MALPEDPDHEEYDDEIDDLSDLDVEVPGR